jgi:hypothetical protein
VLHHGTYEEDGSVTWEILASPREIRSDGEPVIHLQSCRVCKRTRQPPSESAEQALAPRGRSQARGTEAVAEGGEEVGGPYMSFDVGELVGNSDPAEQRGPVLM